MWLAWGEMSPGESAFLRRPERELEGCGRKGPEIEIEQAAIRHRTPRRPGSALLEPLDLLTLAKHSMIS